MQLNRNQRRSLSRKSVRDKINRITGGTPCDYIMKMRETNPDFICSNRRILELLNE